MKLIGIEASCKKQIRWTIILLRSEKIPNIRVTRQNIDYPQWLGKTLILHSVSSTLRKEKKYKPYCMWVR